MDVFEKEPLAPMHILRQLTNVLATPHLGYVTENNYRLHYQQTVENIEAYFAGMPIRALN